MIQRDILRQLVYFSILNSFTDLEKIPTQGFLAKIEPYTNSHSRLVLLLLLILICSQFFTDLLVVSAEARVGAARE